MLFLTADADRGARFDTFLKPHGFRCSVIPYEKVTRDAIDAHDLVIVDTPESTNDRLREYFGWQRTAVKHFPITRKPILAMGFVGYGVLGKHGVAFGKVFT